jgi:predicted alpha/beta superfamily hydrolase
VSTTDGVAAPVLADTEAFDMASSAVGDQFRIFVARCHAPDAVGVPVVYLSDANGTFGMTVDIVRYLQLGRLLPGLLVVGIGYPVAGFRGAQLVRSRDLTPTRRDELHDGDGNPLPSGGAGPFLAFVADELQPAVAHRYPIGEDSTYVGHSFGGLFGAYTLLERPATFDRYLLASPSIWWDDRVLLGRTRGATPESDGRQTSVAILVGEEETPEGRRAAAIATGAPAPTTSAHDLLADAHDYAAALRAWPWAELGVRYRSLPDEHHTTVPSIAISLGLRALFGAPGADRLVPHFIG